MARNLTPIKALLLSVTEYGLDLIKRFEGFGPTIYICPAGLHLSRGLGGHRIRTRGSERVTEMDVGEWTQAERLDPAKTGRSGTIHRVSKRNNVGTPDSIGTIDREYHEKARINPMCRMRLAGSRRLINGLEGHEAHRTANGDLD